MKLNTTYFTYIVYAEKLKIWTSLETIGNLFIPPIYFIFGF